MSAIRTSTPELGLGRQWLRICWHLILCLAIQAVGLSMFAQPSKRTPSPAFALVQPHLAKALRAASKPFNRAHPDFSSLDGLFRPAKLIGLGQNTHGTKQIFQAQADLWIYLVAKHGVRTLLWEDSWGNVAPINDYIQGTATDLGPLAKNLMRPWRTKEVGDLFHWMRNWNLAHPTDRVDLLGIDIQSCSERTFKDLGELISKDEDPKWKELLTNARVAALPLGTVYVALDDTVAALAGAEQLVRHVEAMVCSQPDKAWLPGLIAGRSIVGALQMKVGSAYLEHTQVGKTIGISMPSSAVGLIRDSAMATNVLTLMDNQPTRKFAIFAHSFHLSKDTIIDCNLSMGTILAQAFQDTDDPDGYKPEGTFCTIAIGTRCGSVLAMSESEVQAFRRGGPLPMYKANTIPKLLFDSLEWMLGRIGKGKDMLVNLHKTNGWLNYPLSLFTTGSTMATANESGFLVDEDYNYASGPVARMFDAVVFLDKTEASTTLDAF